MLIMQTVKIDDYTTNLVVHTIEDSSRQTNQILGAQVVLQKSNFAAIRITLHARLEPKKSVEAHRIDHLCLSILVSRISENYVIF